MGTRQILRPAKLTLLKVMFYQKSTMAIIIESRPDISLDEYTAAVGKLVGANNIRFASRMFHGRICMLIDCKQTADDLTEKHTSIAVQKNTLEQIPPSPPPPPRTGTLTKSLPWLCQKRTGGEA